MRVETRSVLAADKIRKTMFLGLATIGMVIPSSGVALSHCGPGNTALQNNTVSKTLRVDGMGPVELILTDPQGRRTGFDPIRNTSFHDIPKAEYGVFEHPCSLPGKFLEVPNPTAGQYTLDVIGTGSDRFWAGAIISNGSGIDNMRYDFFGATAPGRSSRFTFPGKIKIFAAFGATMKIDSVSKTFEVDGTFSLGQGETIQPMTQPVTIELWNDCYSSAQIPAGSFRPSAGRMYVFHGVIDDTAVNANVTPMGGDRYAFKIEGATVAPCLPDHNPVKVMLVIGDYGKSIEVNAGFNR